MEPGLENHELAERMYHLLGKPHRGKNLQKTALPSDTSLIRSPQDHAPFRPAGDKFSGLMAILRFNNSVERLTKLIIISAVIFITGKRHTFPPVKGRDA